MKFRLFVKVFLKNGTYEGIFLHQTNEYLLSVRIQEQITLTMPWEMVSSAIFIPDPIVQRKTEEKGWRQMLMFEQAQQ